MKKSSGASKYKLLCPHTDFMVANQLLGKGTNINILICEILNVEEEDIGTLTIRPLSMRWNPKPRSAVMDPRPI